MANITVNFAYVNRAKFTAGNKARLNLSLSESVGTKDDKKYINYETTLWEDEAIYYHSILGDEPKGTACSFSGYITEITANASKDGDKIYTSVRVNLNKAGNASTFSLLPDFRKGVKSDKKLADDDF